MSKEEDTLKRLESKIDSISEQLRDTSKLIGKLGLDTVFSEASRTMIEELKRGIERRMFFRGLILGLVLGILGNVLVSYWMEYLKAFSIPLWLWALGTAFAFLAVLGLIWRLDRESRR